VRRLWETSEDSKIEYREESRGGTKLKANVWDDYQLYHDQFRKGIGDMAEHRLVEKRMCLIEKLHVDAGLYNPYLRFLVRKKGGVRSYLEQAFYTPSSHLHGDQC